MAKRKYMIYVDQDVYESLRKVVEARGMALSPYIETLLRENLIALEELKDVRTIGDISVSQLFKLFLNPYRIFNMLRKSRKNNKKMPLIVGKPSRAFDLHLFRQGLVQI